MHSTLSLASFVVAIMLALSGSGAAQEFVETRMETELHPPEHADGWAGEPMDGHLDVRLCWDGPGGLNPQDESFNVSVGVDQDLPSGISIQIEPHNFDLTPPDDPLDEGCTDPFNVTITFEWLDSVQPNVSFDVNVTLSTDDEAVGTYGPPQDETATFTIQTVPASELPPNDDDDDDEDENDENDTPAPAVGLLLLFVMGLVFTWRRR